MKTKIEIIPINAEVYILCRNGFQKGKVTSRKINDDNTVRYGVKVQGARQNQMRNEDEVFDSVDQLYNYLKSQIDKEKNCSQDNK